MAESQNFSTWVTSPSFPPESSATGGQRGGVSPVNFLSAMWWDPVASGAFGFSGFQPQLTHWTEWKSGVSSFQMTDFPTSVLLFPRSLQIAPAVNVWPPFGPFSRNFPWSLEFLTSFLLLQGKGWVWKCHFPETSLRKAALFSPLSGCKHATNEPDISSVKNRHEAGGALSAFSRNVKSCFREIIHLFFVWVLMSLTFYFPSGLTPTPPPSQRNVQQCSGDTR